MIKLILLFCALDIDPKYDKDFCVEYMHTCYKISEYLDTCADFYDTDFYDSKAYWENYYNNPLTEQDADRSW